MVAMRWYLIASLALVGCGSSPELAPSFDATSTNDAGNDAAPVDPGDLLAGSWTCLEGATPDGDAVRIAPIDRWIVGYEPAPRTANPPIMLVGPHLEVTGGFRLQVNLSTTG